MLYNYLFIKNALYASDDGTTNNWGWNNLGNDWDKYTRTDPDDKDIENILYTWISRSGAGQDPIAFEDE